MIWCWAKSQQYPERVHEIGRLGDGVVEFVESEFAVVVQIAFSQNQLDQQLDVFFRKLILKGFHQSHEAIED